MDVVWLLISLVFLGVLGIALFSAVMAESGLEPVRVLREALLLAAALGGLVLYVLVIGERLTPAWALGTFVAGASVGYATTWSRGHTALSGIALVPTSRLYPIATLLAAIVMLIGSLGPWIQMLAVGLIGLHGAVGIGIGRYAYRLPAARRAATVFSAEVWVALEATCASCGSPHRPADRFCGTCGAEQPRTCHACGVAMAANSTRCHSCDTAVSSPIPLADDDVWRRTCLVCATPLDRDADYCPTCGIGTTPACPHCGGPVLPGEVDCPVCGIDLEVAQVAADDAAGIASEPLECAKCGAAAHPGARFCRECGTEL